jgi:hypothetical protein
MAKKFNFSLNIPNNIWLLLLVVVLVIVVMNRCNKEGFGFTLESSDFSELDNEPVSLENKYSKFEKNICGPIVPGQVFFATTKFDHECCNEISQYFSRGGCPCMCPEQLEYINRHGNNRT